MFNEGKSSWILSVTPQTCTDGEVTDQNATSINKTSLSTVINIVHLKIDLCVKKKTTLTHTDLVRTL